MNFVDARQYALEFWKEPEFTPFPADIQDKLLASPRADLIHTGAMSVVYNGLLACDTAYIDAADEILRGVQIDTATTGDAMRVARDICYLGLFRGIIDPDYKANFNLDPKKALKTSIETRDKLVGSKDFHAGEAAGIISEALVISLLNEAGFETVPSLPWQDQPYGISPIDPNPAFDAYVLTGDVTRSKVQVKSSLAKPPSGFNEDIHGKWNDLDLQTRRDITVRSYAPDIAVFVLETELGIVPEYQQKHFRSLLQKANSSSRAWMLKAMNTVAEAVW